MSKLMILSIPLLISWEYYHDQDQYAERAKEDDIERIFGEEALQIRSGCFKDEYSSSVEKGKSSPEAVWLGEGMKKQSVDSD